MKKILVLLLILITLSIPGFGQQALVKPSISPNFIAYDFWVGSNETWKETFGCDIEVIKQLTERIEQLESRK